MWYLQVPVGAYKYLRQSLVIIDFTVLRKNIFIEGAPKNGWGDEQKQFIKSKTPYLVIISARYPPTINFARVSIQI
jgi:hypothetical protein